MPRSRGGPPRSRRCCSRPGSRWRRSSARRTRRTRCPVWRAISPVRTVHRLLGGRSVVDRYPDALGYWPAIVGLFAFVWLELASPDPGSLAAIKVWLLVYLLVTLVGAF